jgi:predicted ABC-type transport system involved in lysophospholipase L1 biosynthesis ATPase subunit
MNNDYIVQATDVYKIYHTGLVSVPALRGIDLSVRRGEMLAVMGPSGRRPVGGAPTTGAGWRDGRGEWIFHGRILC